MAKKATNTEDAPTVTIVEVTNSNRFGKISIRPYVEQNVQNMGLEAYNLALFDGVAHEEPVTCLEINGSIRYITGLNPFAPEIKKIANQQDREAAIKKINKTVAQIESELMQNILDPEDPNFWNNVKLLRPDNGDFWEKITVRCSNDVIYLNPEQNIYDLIKLHVIEAGGFSIIAKSIEDAQARAIRPKFYLDKESNTASARTAIKKLTNAAIATLDELFKTNTSKLFLVAKVVDSDSSQYRKSTPLDIIYDNMDNYIRGFSYETRKDRAANAFTDACNQDMETLKIRALIKDASIYKLIQTKSDGMIIHVSTRSQMGRSVSDVVEYLKDPLNDQILGDLLSTVEAEWIK